AAEALALGLLAAEYPAGEHLVPLAAPANRLLLRAHQLFAPPPLGDVADDAQDAIALVGDEPRLEIADRAARQLQRVLDDDRLLGRRHLLERLEEFLGHLARKDVAHVPAEETLRRDIQKLGVPCVIVEIDAVARHDEHQIGNRPQDGVASGLRDLERFLGAALIGDVATDALQLDQAPAGIENRTVDPLLPADVA